MTLTVRHESPADLNAIFEVNEITFGQEAEGDLTAFERAGSLDCPWSLRSVGRSSATRQTPSEQPMARS